MQLGTWKGQVDHAIIPLDDFDILLGMDFLCKVSVIPMLFCNLVCIMEKGAPCMVQDVGISLKEG